jgi:hypothetical protein
LATLRWTGVNEGIVDDLLERAQQFDDERLLKAVVAASNAGKRERLLELMPRFSDRYWQMRILQAMLEHNREIPIDIVNGYPTEFLQAMARAKHRPAIPIANALLRRTDTSSNPRVIAFYAWAMYELGEYRTVIKVANAFRPVLSKAADRKPPRE